ncbi:MAG: hypothetical protein JXQ30_13675 [Spirochaetes bacterium]|nr:hypothetical protein [Spirochaetota bacterium]
MGRIAKTAIAWLFILAASSGYTDTRDFRVDWRTNEVVVTGVSKIAASKTGNRIEWQHSAAVGAKRLVLESFFASLGALRVDAYRSAKDIMMDNPATNRAVHGYADTLARYQVMYGPDSVTVEKRIPLYGKGGLAPLLIEAGTDPGHFPSYDRLVFSTEFTGLVIDGRGLGRIPAVNPRIFDDDHNLVYSADLIQKDAFARWGALRYTDDPYLRGCEMRVGANPLRLIAIENPKLIETDLCISKEDAMILLQEEETRSRLEEGMVVIILDSL